MKVQMSNLGVNGRFGNQIFQYFFLKLIEKELGYKTFSPPWFGNTIFNIAKNNVKEECSSSNFFPFERIHSKNDSPELHLRKIKEITNFHKFNLIDISGYFQYHTKYFQKYREEFESIFTIDSKYVKNIEDCLKKIKKDSQPIIAIHFRLGDYIDIEKMGDPNYVPPSIDEIAKQIDEIYSQVNERKPIVYLGSDDLPQASTMLSSKGIPHVTALDLGFEKKEDLLTLDFTLFTLADILPISNSSFSFAAAMLNKKSNYFFRPRIGDKKFVAFDPWNDYVIRTKVVGLYI